MIVYKRCTQVHEDDIFNAFQIGFSDYIIKFELTKETFKKHFFGPEGNRPEYSVIAFDEDKPIGLNLGSIKVYEGIKTLRCGALCVHPDYRGTEVAGKLFSFHKEIALENDCRQMFLEVIKGNDRAISFYIKKGYEKVYDLVYYSHKNPSEINAVLPDYLSIKRVDIDCLKGINAIQNTHINWQNDFDYIGYFSNQVHYGVYNKENLIGALSLQPSGRINFLWVDFSLRNKGIGSALIGHAVNELNIKKLTINFPNNASLMGFVKRWNFEKDSISQYEMYLTL